uniref:Secreted protein n=1 Tax=Amphiprion percula TaxID=161767 RepID=A0A3P8SQ89_AMPPE
MLFMNLCSAPLLHFLSCCFPANDCRLSRPLCPISPQREEIRTAFRPNLLHLSVLLQKLTSTCLCFFSTCYIFQCLQRCTLCIFECCVVPSYAA